MKDEEYLYHAEVRERKNVANSARHRRTHCGKGGRVRLPSDYKTKKELNEMNGEVKTYRLNSPMTWDEFDAMPVEHKVTYIKLLRQKYHVPDKYLAEMFGISTFRMSMEMKKLDLSVGHRNYQDVFDKEGFLVWVHGIKEEAKEECPVQYTHYEIATEVPVVEEVAEPIEETAEEVPVEETAGVVHIDTIPAGVRTYLAESEKEHAIPETGNMVFKGKTEDILRCMGLLLGGANVHISITWDVLED